MAAHDLEAPFHVTAGARLGIPVYGVKLSRFDGTMTFSVSATTVTTGEPGRRRGADVRFDHPGVHRTTGRAAGSRSGRLRGSSGRLPGDLANSRCGGREDRYG
ncbi:hypothetical protein [Kribbella karoonensis]|uniref:hypothetical protein n=1 Tax=Kribbella karoonensis TaxID=324851 RepID=UPI0031D8EBA3